MFQLQRITTEYVEAEDRIRLSGEDEQENKLVLWLTQRLLSQVIAHLIGLIEKQDQGVTKNTNKATDTLRQSFAQQAAQAAFSSEPPVQTPADSQSWLVREVDITLTSEAALVMVFKQKSGAAEINPNEQSRLSNEAILTVEAKKLRQWLGIIHTQWQRAGWPLALWPSWIEATDAKPSENISSLH
jgi:hypothetical protein